jgi:hypothetical protein
MYRTLVPLMLRPAMPFFRFDVVDRLFNRYRLANDSDRLLKYMAGCWITRTGFSKT